MALLNRTELNERLQSNIVEVHFNKVNGDHRVMRATLNPALIPGGIDGDPTDGPEETGRVNVYDMDKQAWRSFLIERVTTVMTPARNEILSRPQGLGSARVTPPPARTQTMADRVATSLKDIITNPRV